MLINLQDGTEVALLIGDTIKFKSITRWNIKTQERKVKNITEGGKIEIRFGGYSDFVVHQHEIINVYPS